MERQRVMAMQTALRRAQAQDEAMLRNGSSNSDELPLLPVCQKTPPLIHSIERSLDCDSSASSQCSNPPSVARKLTPTAVIPSTTTVNIGTAGECHSSYNPEYKGNFILKTSLF
ncbi:hypothetical protein NQ314_002146 [Rhamnusium bicolor]|uniref:Uncharacterized protein n=1 Tax=Rhamnusium bicolor TaxID=1586634 RepID=A0AAV8ZT09_9CUCU|nr:hypothetical protein NQ314_002146 [Rhamnusium bicolor]